MSIDWANAPEGTTHYAPAYGSFRWRWARIRDGEYEFFSDLSGEWYWGAQPFGDEQFIERPQEIQQ